MHVHCTVHSARVVCTQSHSFAPSLMGHVTSRCISISGFVSLLEKIRAWMIPQKCPPLARAAPFTQHKRPPWHKAHTHPGRLSTHQTDSCAVIGLTYRFEKKGGLNYGHVHCMRNMHPGSGQPITQRCEPLPRCKNVLSLVPRAERFPSLEDLAQYSTTLARAFSTA